MYQCIVDNMTKFSRWQTLEERFDLQHQKSAECWLWTGSIQKAGPYGVIKLKNKVLLAHRVSYERFIGSIPDGMTIDHLCANTLCVNPSHLEIITRSENSKREMERLRRPTCPKGHNRFSIRSNGKRQCLDCMKDAYYARKAKVGT